VDLPNKKKTKKKKRIKQSPPIRNKFYKERENSGELGEKAIPQMDLEAYGLSLVLSQKKQDSNPT